MASLVERNLCQCFSSVSVDAIRICPPNRVVLPSRFSHPPSRNYKKTLKPSSASSDMASKTSSTRSDAQRIHSDDAAADEHVGTQSLQRHYQERTLPSPVPPSSVCRSERSPTGNIYRRDIDSSSCHACSELALNLSSITQTSEVGLPFQRTVANPYRRTSLNSGNGVKLLPPATSARVRRTSLDSRLPSAQAAPVLPAKTTPSREEATTAGRHRRYSLDSTPVTPSFYVGTAARGSPSTPRNASLKPILKGGSRPSSCSSGRMGRRASGPVLLRSSSCLAQGGHPPRRPPTHAGGTIRSKTPGPKFSYRLDPSLVPDVKRVTFNDDVSVVGSDGVRRRRHSSPCLTGCLDAAGVVRAPQSADRQ